MADEGVEEPAGLPVPDADAVVPAAGGQPPADRAEGQGIHEVDVAAQLMNDRPARAGEVAEVDDVPAGQGEPAAVGGEPHAEHAAGAASDRCAERSTGPGVAQPGIAGRGVL